jgi:hypothetical protein
VQALGAVFNRVEPWELPECSAEESGSAALLENADVEETSFLFLKRRAGQSDKQNFVSVLESHRKPFRYTL